MIDFRCREASAGLISYWTSSGSVDHRSHELLRQLTKRFSLIVSVERLNALLQAPGRHKGEIEEALAKLVDADPSADKLVADYLDQKPLEYSLLRYVDFAVRFGPQEGNSHPVCATSPAGEGGSRFRIPVAEEADRVLEAFSAGILTSSPDQVRDLKSVTGDHETQCGATEIGGHLFRALIRDQLRELFEESLRWLSGRDGFGLRLKLHLAPHDVRQARLAALPWEFMYRRERQTFLSLSRKTPIVRYIDVPPGAQASALGSPVRVLIVMSSPAGEEPLDLACERDRLERELATRREVKVKVLDEATIEALHDELLSQPYDILHFMGHGTFDVVTGVGGLVFEDGRGEARTIPAPMLANALRDIGSLRLVVLNACNSARTFYVNGCNPFTGVANALVLAGLPAVAAMQFPMSDRAAIVFSAALYRRLAVRRSDRRGNRAGTSGGSFRRRRLLGVGYSRTLHARSRWSPCRALNWSCRSCAATCADPGQRSNMLEDAIGYLISSRHSKGHCVESSPELIGPFYFRQSQMRAEEIATSSSGLPRCRRKGIVIYYSTLAMGQFKAQALVRRGEACNDLRERQSC